MSLILTALIAFVSIIVPGFFLALALLRKTKLNMFEITVIGFIFGLVFPPTLTWLESYLISYIHAFSFSAQLYMANVVVLTLAGIALSVQQGAISLDFSKSNPSAKPKAAAAAFQAHGDYRERLVELRATIASLNTDMGLVKEHEREEDALKSRHRAEVEKLRDAGPEERSRIAELHADEERRLIEAHEREERVLLDGTSTRASPEAKGKGKVNAFQVVLLMLMLFTFATRIANIGTAAKFFEFDPYFDMQSTEFLLVHGYQWLYDHSAWPTAVNGTVHRIEPLVPYLEAYWYQISNPPAQAINLTLLSNVSSFYPPIAAALLVFVVFMFLDHEYGEKPAIIGAALAAAMPVLISTFIAGEQLVEPWGIFAMFFFYAAYLLAIQNPKEKRYAVLAGVAFASTFLGAHYYTVNAGVFAIYIALQGLINVVKKESMRDFYKMNLIVIGVILLFFLAFNPYNSVLANAVPGVLGVPVIIAFPVLALAFVVIGEQLVNLIAPSLEKQTSVTYVLCALSGVGLVAVAYAAMSNKLGKLREALSRYAVLSALAVVLLLLILLTPLGNPVNRYLALSSHYTTPSTPLFMTVQEYAPTGLNYDYGSAGFGIIGASVLGADVIVWTVLLLFYALALYAVFKRNSKTGLLAIAAVFPLQVAGMIEVKYLPHLGVGYVIAIGFIIGELLLLIKDSKSLDASAKGKLSRGLFAAAIVLVLLESISFVGLLSAVGQSCSTISANGNSIGYSILCNTIPNYWLQATAWMSKNVGPFAPRVLSWWDYGDWINWFGNSNAVLRGDNSVAALDLATAARYVLGSSDGYGPQNLANFSNSVQAKYVLFDDQLTQKWQALDFLACVDVNQTSRAYAIQAANGTGSPYVLGESQCELSHSPAYLYVPVSTSNINNYCQLKDSNVTAVKTLMSIGNGLSNQTYCTPLTNSSAPTVLLYPNGTATNILLISQQQFFFGLYNIGGQQFLDFMAFYLPNGPNGTITDAPTEFYNSNYYRGFYLGKLPGFTIVYPANFTGINYVNGTHQVVIYRVNNYTGSLPYVTPKPSWVNNNFTMPG